MDVFCLDTWVCDSAYTEMGSNEYKVLVGTGFGLPNINTLIRIVVSVFMWDYWKTRRVGIFGLSPKLLLIV